MLGLNYEGGPNFDHQAELAAVVDIDRGRVEAWLEHIGRRIPFYHAADLPRMLAETRPDVLLVATPDGAHTPYIVAGLEAGCDVIVEKPMVINCEQIRAVQEAEKRTGRQVARGFQLPLHAHAQETQTDDS